MKTKFILPTLIVTMSFVLVSFTNTSENSYETVSEVQTIAVPENVKAILDNKCMGCHSNKTKSGKSKTKLNLDKLINGEYSKGKAISKLSKTVKTLSEEKMPPKKFLEKYPHKKLTIEESKILSDWASEQGSLLKGE